MDRYRGKTREGKLIYDSLISSKDGKHTYIGFAELIEEGNFPIIHFEEVLPETVSQFTGLLDKNGKEIYGGSRMNFPCDKKSPDGGYYCGTIGFHPENEKIVEWNVDGCFLGNFRISLQLHLYEVVDSIQDNPELMPNAGKD